MSLHSTAGDKRIFRENFISVKSVSDNGGVITGAPTIKGGAVLDASGKYIDYANLIQPLGTIINSNKRLSIKCVVDTPTDLATYRTVFSFGSATRCVEIGFKYTTGHMYAYSTASSVKSSNSVISAGKHTLEWVFDGTNVYFYTDGVANGSQAFAFTGWTDQTIRLGAIGGGTTQPLLSTIYSLDFFNAVHTAEEAKDLYERDTIPELDHPLIDLPLRSWYYKENGTQLLVDGDMEAADTSAWTVSNVSLEKRTDTPYSGTQYMRVTRIGASPLATQTKLTVGKRYKYSIRMRGDNAGSPGLLSNAFLFQSALLSSADYTLFEGEFVAPVTTISIYPGVVDGHYVDVDEFSVQLMENLTENKGTLGGTAKLGDGSTTTTMPTQLYPKGYRSTGQYLKQIATLPSGTYSVIALIKPTAVTSKYIFDCRADSGTGYLWFSGTDVISASAGTVYRNGRVATGLTGKNGVAQTIGVTGITLDSTSIYMMANYLAANGLLGDLLDIKFFSGTLTPQQMSIEHTKMMKLLNV